MGKLLVVVGGQFGSEGKGAVAARLTSSGISGVDTLGVRVAGPNAGHTVYGALCPPDCEKGADHWHRRIQPVGDPLEQWIGHPWRLRAVPVTAVSNLEAQLLIAAGSEVDLGVLGKELYDLDNAGYRASERLVVDNSATMLDGKYIEEEVKSDLTARLGSTAKGIGAARSARIWREAKVWGDGDDGVDGANLIYRRLANDWTVMIEGTQGYGLGLHTENYPQVTSSDCRAVDFLGMAGVSPWAVEVTSFQVWVVARVRPIRVAGNSGRLRGETSWEQLGLPEERTTVTKKIRRVGEWDADLVKAALRANGGADSPNVKLALTMVDSQLDGVVGAQTATEMSLESRAGYYKYLGDIEKELGIRVSYVGTGPNSALNSGTGRFH